MRLSDDAQRVAVRRALQHDLAADEAAGARPVVDHRLLAVDVAEFLPEDACEKIARRARRERHDQPDRLGRELLLRRCGYRNAPNGCCQTHCTKYRFDDVHPCLPV